MDKETLTAFCLDNEGGMVLGTNAGNVRRQSSEGGSLVAGLVRVTVLICARGKIAGGDAEGRVFWGSEITKGHRNHILSIVEMDSGIATSGYDLTVVTWNEKLERVRFFNIGPELSLCTNPEKSQLFGVGWSRVPWSYELKKPCKFGEEHVTMLLASVWFKGSLLCIGLDGALIQCRKATPNRILIKFENPFTKMSLRDSSLLLCGDHGSVLLNLESLSWRQIDQVSARDGLFLQDGRVALLRDNSVQITSLASSKL